MLNKIASKAMRIARGTALAMGAAVMLALVLGVATTALAGTGFGATFNLGQLNGVNAVSRLVGGVSGPMLLVDNNGSGPALDLRVGPSNTAPAAKTVAPMKVDSQARVTNLNADEIDGLDSTQIGRTVARPGQVLSGDLATRYVPDDLRFAMAAASYPVPLPAGTPTPSLEYVFSEPTADCPGFGRAAPGVLCIYSLSEHNFGRVGYGGNTGDGGNHRLYGFVLDVYPADATRSGFFAANWAYKVPSGAS